MHVCPSRSDYIGFWFYNSKEKNSLIQPKPVEVTKEHFECAMVVKNHSMNANQNTLLVVLATIDAHLTPVKLIELCFNSQNKTWTLKSNETVSRPQGQETRMRNCFFFENQEVMLVMERIIIFLDKNLREKSILKPNQINENIVFITCCSRDLTSTGFIFAFSVLPSL